MVCVVPKGALEGLDIRKGVRMHRSSKPVRKCNGCGLNLRDRCGVYDNPHGQWERRKQCSGYMNEKLLQEYEEHAAKLKLDARKIKRKEEAKKSRAEPHHDGDRHVMVTTVG